MGGQLKKLFPKREKKQKEILETESISDMKASHKFWYGVVYANDSAKAEIEKEKPDFPAGAIIVREKNASETAAVPDTVIAMVKREKGFSAETNDWEFVVLSGTDLKMQKRETKGDCAACHNRAAATDWVFRDYLKAGFSEGSR